MAENKNAAQGFEVVIGGRELEALKGAAQAAGLSPDAYLSSITAEHLRRIADTACAGLLCTPEALKGGARGKGAGQP